LVITHATKRVVFYARYSTDQQNPASIERSSKRRLRISAINWGKAPGNFMAHR